MQNCDFPGNKLYIIYHIKNCNILHLAMELTCLQSAWQNFHFQKSQIVYGYVHITKI